LRGVGRRRDGAASGPARKYYSITPEGRADLDAADAEWARLARVVNRLLEMRNDREQR
jgi:PadR family transcriptional regulator